MKQISSLLALLATGLQSYAGNLDVVILTGRNNHDWKATTPALEAILKQGGASSVDVVTNPERLTADMLAEYDVLLSNWNAFGAGNAAPWSPALQSAYVQFVRNGGGHVVVHAGSSSFPDWKDYQAICLATWKAQQTGHGPQHSFEVRIAQPDHPITRDMTGFTTHDELWHRPGVHPDATTVTEAYSSITQRWEPSALAGQFGKGRCFTLLLGHGAQHMEYPEFQALLLRGTRWARSLSE